MQTFDVTVEMAFPDDLHAEDIINIAEGRLNRKIKKITESGKTNGEQVISINVKTLLTPEAHERLEDELAKFLRSQRIEAVLENSVTGNSTRTKRG